MKSEEPLTAQPEVVEAEVVPEPAAFPEPSVQELAQALVGLGYQLSLLAARFDAMERYVLGPDSDEDDE